MEMNNFFQPTGSIAESDFTLKSLLKGNQIYKKVYFGYAIIIKGNFSTVKNKTMTRILREFLSLIILGNLATVLIFKMVELPLMLIISPI